MQDTQEKQGKQSKENIRKNYIKVQSALSWDEYFMLQAMLASFKSKDPNTKVGCVFVDNNNHQISMGFNGQLPGIDEEEIPWGNATDVPLNHQKYGYVIHSEANAIMHAEGSLKDSRGYVTLFPCHECAKLIASQKVREIIYLNDKYSQSESVYTSKKIFELANISTRHLILRQNLLDTLHMFMQSFLDPT